MTIKDFCGAIEAAAARTPDKIAIEEAHATITYRDLIARARTIDVPPHVPIGIQLPPSIDYVITFLGVSMRNAIPMPIDVNVPPLRLKQILEKSGCLCVETAAPGRRTMAEAAVSTPNSPDAPAYILFTSGSTGTPKAILGRHAGLSHFLRWELTEFNIDGSARVSWLAPPTFDVSLRDILIPLCAGGTLCIPSEDTRTNPRLLLQWLTEQKITLTHIVPTLFRLLLTELESTGTRPHSLQHILLAGEPLYGHDINRWRAVMGEGTQLVNLYGPSETTLAKAFHRIPSGPLEPAKIVPIGQPLPNTAFLILEGDRLCDIGEIGEIYIKTPYRSLGYLNDPELTAAAFVDNPLQPGQHDVVYRTGDLGRYLPDRSVECLGRLDHQVKINGIRIEPAEIEHAVRQLEGIHEAVVTPHKTAQGTTALACYYTLSVPSPRQRREGQGEGQSLRDSLSQSLPPSMIPTFFIELDSMPTTVSGKINRRALPRPEELLYEKRAYRAPASELETKLANIWGDVLGLKKVSADHPFVELGGDSLKGIRVVSAIFRELGVEIALKELFESATIAALAPRIAHAKQSRIEEIPALPPAPDYPVSHAQHRLWTLDRMEIDSVAYNLPLAFHLRGPLDVEKLRNAFARLVARHESLRTTFLMRADALRQRVAPAVPHIPVIDLSSHDDPDRAAEEILERDRSTGFDLEHGPLLRAKLLRLGSVEHVLAVCLHHIICDVWSLNILEQELQTLYDGPAAPLEPLRIHYRDFAAWQNERLASGALDADRAYWRDKLGGELPVLALPTDAPRPAVQTFRGTTYRHRIAGDALARFDASTFVVLQAVVKTLLHRWTSQRDLIVGSPVLGRQHPDLESQVGLYVNTLALRDELDPDESFAQLVQRVQQTTHDAFAHQAFPFDVLIDELQLARDMSHSPLFDVMLVVQEEDRQHFAPPYGRENAWEFSRFDLVFHFTKDGDELVLDLNYNTDLFHESRARAMAAQVETLLHHAAEAPSTPIGDLAYIPLEERTRIERFSTADDRQPHGLTIVARFEDQVARTPDDIALVHGDRALTYAELDALANDVARNLDVQRGDRVVVTLRRSIDAMAALLGVMKAGAIYVPVDPDLPEARIQAIYDDARPTVIVTSPLSPQSGERVAEGRVRGRVTAPDPAYIIYTSGSTGTPKGVLVAHEGFVNMSLCQNETFGVTASDRVAQFASASFDASLAEIFSAWFAGAALVLVDRATIENPAAFLHFMDAQRITVITLPPVYLATLNRAPMPTLRVLITAGEAARASDLRHYAKTKHVFNAYGPTETSVCATMHRVTQHDDVIPIGKPVDGTTVMVLDERMHEVPIGVPGEICVAGRGLAVGYHANPAATAEKFITRNDTRIYKTGDRGRWREDGALEFLGRLDHQVKVHGHRVELGAIERALRECEGVGDAFVTTLDGDLAAWVTPPKALELWPSVAEFFVYDDVLYRSMASDEERNRRYREVFAEKLKGAVVVEVGPGAECVLSRLALDAGAAHVYAIEILRETYERAKQTIDRLGLSEKITLIHGDAMQVELPEKADWCISEIVGGIGGSEGAAAILNSVRRLLKRGEQMIPRRSVTRIAAVEADDVALSFSEIAAHYVRRIFEDAGAPFDLRVCLKNAGPQHLLSTTGILEDLDFTRDSPLEAEHRTSMTIERDGTMNGFLVWLNLHVDEERVVDILRDQASWLPVYVPMPPRRVRAGEVLDVTIARTLCDAIHPDFTIRGDDFEVALPHRASHFRATPFYERLFAEGIPVTREADLREQLQSRLASHEMPSYITRIDQLPLNRSGKVDRKALPDPRATQREVAEEAMSDLETRIAAAWRDVLGTAVSLDDDFFSRGGDSIKAIRIVSLLHQQHIRLELRDIFQHPTVRACAAVATSAVANIDQAPLSGEIPPTPIQRWFFEHFKHAPHHYNQSIVLRPRTPLDRDALRVALEAVVQHHDALRMRVCDGRPFISGDATIPLDEWTCDEAQWRELADDVHASFDFHGGPLVRALLLHLPDGDALWLIAHHLTIDVVSWSILVEDLEAAYRAAREHRAIRLPLKTHSIAAFANALPDFEDEREYWANIDNPLPPVRQRSHPPVYVLDVDLDLDETRELLSAGRGNEIVLTALGNAMRKWCGAERTVVDVESHGRTLPGIDVSRTIGWFTTFYPIVLEAGQRPPEVPSHGLGYGVLTQLGEPRLAEAHAEIGFNYLGELTSAPRSEGLFAIEWDAPGAPISPDAERVHAIEVLAVVLDGRLRITLSFAGNRDSAIALADALRTALEEMRGSAASFTFAGLTDAQLDELMSGL